MKTARCVLLQLVAATALVACGGGGGGGSGSAGPDAPTLVLNTAFNASEVAQLGMDGAAQSLQLSQFAVDLAHRLAAPGAAPPISALCGGSGTVTLRLDDRDASGHATAGDTITAVLDRCGVPVLLRVATGTVKVELLGTPGTRIDNELDAQVSFPNGLALATAGSRFRHSVTLPDGSLSGSLRASWSATPAGSQLRATSSTADDLRLSSSLGGAVRELSWRHLDVGRRVQFDEALVTNTLALVVDLGASSGRFVVSTSAATPWVSHLNRSPHLGSVEMQTASGTVRVKSGSYGLMNAETLNPQGTVTATNPVVRNVEHGVLAWDGRGNVSRSFPVDSGTTGDRLEVPHDIGTAVGYDLRDLFSNHPDADPRALQIDPLFVHPVLAAPGGASADAVFRFQFGTAMAETQPALHFRFKDLSAGDAVLPRSHVPATYTRLGALFLVRPTESLRHGTSFDLEVSADGSTWFGGVPMLRRNGEAVSFGSTLGWVQTPFTLAVSLDRIASVIPAATSPALLSATITSAPGRTIRGTRWEQLSGEPLVLATPDAASTWASYPVGTPRAYGTATVQLTVTDSQGEVERSQIVLRVGDFVPTGSLWFQRSTTSTVPQPFLKLWQGSASVAASTLQSQAMTMQMGAEVITLGAADGARLAVGVYENATTVPATPGRPLLRCVGQLGDCGNKVVGRFEVLEVAYAADGSLARLAVDYEQSIEDGLVTSTTKGSLRINSTLSVRP